jgi:cell division protein FtsZ
MSIEMIEVEEFHQGTQIKVIGVGGGGGNAVAHMIERGVQGVEFVCANTDAQALQRSNAHKIIQLGTSGLGAGSKPDKGREAPSSRWTTSARPSTARTCCSSRPAWAAAPAPAPRR